MFLTLLPLCKKSQNFKQCPNIPTKGCQEFSNIDVVSLNLAYNYLSTHAFPKMIVNVHI